MSEHGFVHYNNTEIRFAIRRSNKRRHTISILVDPKHGVILRAPVRTPISRLQEVTLDRAEWILERLASDRDHPLASSHRDFQQARSILYLGESYPVRTLALQGGRRKIAGMCDLLTEGLHASLPEISCERTKNTILFRGIRKWYYQHALKLLIERSDHYAKLLGVEYSALLIRDQKRRWGSCDSRGVIRYNWKIMMTPLKLIDYLVVHELCHLRVRDHSSRFWNLVGTILPDYRERREELRKRDILLSFEWPDKG
jgi:predicted metal-dependent hydrolase